MLVFLKEKLVSMSNFHSLDTDGLIVQRTWLRRRLDGIWSLDSCTAARRSETPKLQSVSLGGYFEACKLCHH
jgi:hypothetical protein